MDLVRFSHMLTDFSGVPTSAAIRLVGSHNNFAGRVEMMVNGTWGTVCSDLWSTMDAIVVCGMLGFPRLVLSSLVFLKIH